MIEFLYSNSVLIFSILLSVTVILLILIRKAKRKKYDVAKISIKDIDVMSGHDFEDYLQVLFAVNGYETFVTKKVAITGQICCM